MAVDVTEDQLGQLRPASADPEVLYTLGSNVRMVGKGFCFCNVTNQKARFSVYSANSAGGSFNKDTAIYFNIELLPFESWDRDTFTALATTGARIAVQSHTAGAINFTLWGAEVA